MSSFPDALAEQILICDGAMGTALHAAGNSLDQSLPSINLSDDGLVGAVHDGYIEAGVDIIQTNTFGASRLRLAPFGFGERVGEINAAGVRIARQAAQRASGRVFVAGSVSPAVTMQQRSTVTAAERTRALREQIIALTEAGVDLLILETFGYLNELVEAVTVAAEHSFAPIVAQATFAADGATLSGHSPQELVQALTGLPINVLGINCTLGPQGSLEVLTELARHTELPLSAQPNAGLPRRISSGKLSYEVDPEYFARYAERLVAAGAVLVGGCCGTTPLHVGAMAKVVEAAPRRSAAQPATGVVHEPRPQSPPSSSNRKWLDAPGLVVMAELVPSASGAQQDCVAAAEKLHDSGSALFSISATPRGRAQRAVMNQSVDLAATVQERLEIPAIAGVTTWNRTIMALQAQLLGAQARGVTRIVCETGNPPLMGDYPTVDGKWEVDSVGLIELLANLNGGVDHNGLRIAGGVEFEIGARVNPGAHDFALELERTLRKIAAGASFLITRPVYEPSGLAAMLEAIDGAVPVLAALRPLSSFDEAERLRYEVPDVVIPAAVMDRMQRAGTSAARVGLDIAAELAVEVSGLVRGVMVSSVDNEADSLVELVQSVVGISPAP